MDYKVKTVQVKVDDAFQEREIRALSSQMKQALIKRLQEDVMALSKLKKKGVKVGRIKFVKAVHSIPLTQYGVTYWVKKHKGVHVQGIGNFKVSGLGQLPENAEFSSANFVERNAGRLLPASYVLSAQRGQKREREGHGHRPRREEPTNLLQWGQNSIFIQCP